MFLVLEKGRENVETGISDQKPENDGCQAHRILRDSRILMPEESILPISQTSEPDLWVRVFGPRSWSDRARLGIKPPASKLETLFSPPFLCISQHAEELVYFVYITCNAIWSQSIGGFYLQCKQSMEDHAGILQCTHFGALLSFGTGQIVYESMVPFSYILQASFIELRLQLLE